MNQILNINPKQLLVNFINDYSNLYTIDKSKALKYIQDGIKLGSKAQYQQELINKWYYSLKNNNPNYNLYNDKYYFTDLWVCWHLYSRPYLRFIQKHNSLDKNTSIYSILKNINYIADLGCGISFTTAVLKQIFPYAKVYGTNLENTEQYLFCKNMSKKYNFNIVPSVKNIPENIDFLFASEYFEHIINPLEHIEEIIKYIKPRYLYIANSFNTISVGHFEIYEKTIEQKKISKEFNNVLRKNNYKKLKTKLWNNKPALWIKNAT